MSIEYKILTSLLDKAKKDNQFQTKIAGDDSEFRYPQFNSYANNFDYDDKNNVFVLKPYSEEIISLISINEITVYEMLNSYAKKLHLYDFLGYKASYHEKLIAYMNVLKEYRKNMEARKWPYDLKISKINIGNIKIRKGFESISSFINRSKENIVYMGQFQNVPKTFQFGSTLKGTNIVFTDNNKANAGQEIFHAVYHLEEGIRGFNNDNLNILEKWADVPLLYLLQLVEGRLTRRIRQNTSPHDIKFLDYVFLRAYIGQAFIDETANPYYHSIYSLIEPSIKLLLTGINEKDPAKVNDLLIKAICNDETTVLRNEFNLKYGQGSYEKIYYDYNLFNRLNSINEICDTSNIDRSSIYKEMFSSKELVSTVISNEIVALVWMSEKINRDKKLIIDLIEDYSNNCIKENKVIMVEDWLNHIRNIFGVRKYDDVSKEYEKREKIIGGLKK